MPPTLRGERVVLRTISPDDVMFCHTFANDPDLRGWLRFETPITQRQELSWIESLDEESERVWLMTRDTRPIGLIGLHEWDHAGRHAELGLGILRAEDRAGGNGADAIRLALRYGFSEMALDRVWLRVHADNPARRLYARLGFVEEGVQRRHTWKRGAYRDIVLMGLLREEWRA